MNKDDRLDHIIDLLKQENGLPVQILATQLGVSHMTIRRDLETLVERGLVRLIHGGALLNPEVFQLGAGRNYSLIAAGARSSEEKRRIAAAAVEMVEPHDTLIIDIGSTTEWLARQLPSDIELTVISYGLNVVSEVARRPQCNAIVAGGRLHGDTLMFESAEGRDLISRYRANKMFVSAAGVNADLGVTCVNAYERETKRVAMESAAEAILLADSSKVGMVRPEFFAELSQFGALITDSGIAESDADRIRAIGVSLVIV